MSKSLPIYVYAHWFGMQDPELVGMLVQSDAGRQEIFAFEYDADWLKGDRRAVLDPYLQQLKGKFYPRTGEENFGMFLDCAPGSWGRTLMQKSEIVTARKSKRSATELSAASVLLNVFDYYRSGALRFRTSPEGDFLTSDEQYLLPTFGNLRDLELACAVCESQNVNDPEFIRAIEFLGPPGSALGGKRPKANAIDDEWQMWIAKFPSVNDQHDVGGWEYVAHTLAGLAGVHTSPAAVKRFSSAHHTFITQRFDRTSRGERIHFASAMTLLGYAPGDESRMGVSYLSLVEFLMRHGADVNNDLEELWRRIVFNIAIRNTDDHLRNHGFLLTEGGWKLAPAFDMNPNVFGAGLTLNISESENELDFDLAMSVARYFRVKPERAKNILAEVRVAARQWNKVAGDAGISKVEQERMSSAFER